MTKLRHLIGIIKDKASRSKAALLSKGTTLSLLRATSHDRSRPPTRKHLDTILSSGDGSRATASAAVEVLMDRLQGTNNAAVALKCLIAVHHIIHHGSFILQDQLSVYPSTGGRNYLNLSNFRHDTDPTSWELSSWVRWFAQHIEQLLCTSRILGFFIGSTTDREDRVSGLTSADLLTEFDSLVTLVEGICKMPQPNGNRLVEEIVKLTREDLVVVEVELRVRVNEFNQRLGCFNFGEAVHLLSSFKRLEACHGLIQFGFFHFLRDLKDKAQIQVYRQEANLRRETIKLRLTQSHRFSSRLLINSPDFLTFPSARFL